MVNTSVVPLMVGVVVDGEHTRGASQGWCCC